MQGETLWGTDRSASALLGPVLWGSCTNCCQMAVVPLLTQSLTAQGLGDLYAEDYQAKVQGVALTDKHERLRAELRRMAADLFAKLDALSHFHYAPFQPAEDVTVQPDVPSLAAEEVAPTVRPVSAALQSRTHRSHWGHCHSLTCQHSMPGKARNRYLLSFCKSHSAGYARCSPCRVETCVAACRLSAQLLRSCQRKCGRPKSMAGQKQLGKRGGRGRRAGRGASKQAFRRQKQRHEVRATHACSPHV